MAQYIDKVAVVAEIEKRVNSLNKDRDFNYLQIKELEALLSSMDTLEMREVDLNEEIETCLKRHSMLAVGKKDFTNIAKHFFELGLKAQKDNIRHSMDETPKYPCDILFVTEVDTMFLFKYMKNGRPVDRETPYFHNIQNGKCWYYCNNIMNIY
jgi:hypothetical protein